MTATSKPVWRKPVRSMANGNCVEVAAVERTSA